MFGGFSGFPSGGTAQDPRQQMQDPRFQELLRRRQMQQQGNTGMPPPQAQAMGQPLGAGGNLGDTSGGGAPSMGFPGGLASANGGGFQSGPPGVGLGDASGIPPGFDIQRFMQQVQARGGFPGGTAGGPGAPITGDQRGPMLPWQGGAPGLSPKQQMPPFVGTQGPVPPVGSQSPPVPPWAGRPPFGSQVEIQPGPMGPGIDVMGGPPNTQVTLPPGGPSVRPMPSPPVQAPPQLPPRFQAAIDQGRMTPGGAANRFAQFRGGNLPGQSDQSRQSGVTPGAPGGGVRSMPSRPTTTRPQMRSITAQEPAVQTSAPRAAAAGPTRGTTAELSKPKRPPKGVRRTTTVQGRAYR